MMGVLNRRREEKKLRDYCHEKYGDEFIEIYDRLARGEPVGDFAETAMILELIEQAKKNMNLKEREDG